MNFAIFVALIFINQNPDKFYIMNIHEYQGKEILAIRTHPAWYRCIMLVAAAKQLTKTGTSWFKAQVHAGWKRWRSKTCQNLQQVEEVAGQIIGMQLVTTLKLCRRYKVLVAEDVYYPVKVKLQNFTYLFY
jgi:succinyl-CoA synthetase beta subunit